MCKYASIPIGLCAIQIVVSCPNCKKKARYIGPAEYIGHELENDRFIDVFIPQLLFKCSHCHEEASRFQTACDDPGILLEFVAFELDIEGIMRQGLPQK